MCPNVIGISVSGDCIYISHFLLHAFIDISPLHTTQHTHHFYYIMQQECHPDLSHTSSAALHADHDLCSDTVFVLSPADKALLQEHLDEFQDADKGAFVIIIERVMGQLYQLRPSNSSFDKKDASKVMSEIHRYGCH